MTLGLQKFGKVWGTNLNHSVLTEKHQIRNYISLSYIIG